MNFKNVTTLRQFMASPNNAQPNHMVPTQCQSAHKLANRGDSAVGQNEGQIRWSRFYSGSTWGFAEPSNPARYDRGRTQRTGRCA